VVIEGPFEQGLRIAGHVIGRVMGRVMGHGGASIPDRGERRIGARRWGRGRGRGQGQGRGQDRAEDRAACLDGARYRNVPGNAHP
jgi:hypothetical protein